MLYLFAIINLILTALSGLAFLNFYQDLEMLEKSVMFISLLLLLVTNIGIIWVNFKRGNIISELKRKNNMLEQELAAQKKLNEDKDKEIYA